MSLSFISQAADNKLLANCEDMANVVEQFINKEIDIVALFNQLNTNLSLNYDQKIQTFVEQVKTQLKIKVKYMQCRLRYLSKMDIAYFQYRTTDMQKLLGKYPIKYANYSHPKVTNNHQYYQIDIQQPI